ncbi:MAG TPA: hypothetical protein HA326_07990 [Thermoplasmata archaeon]|nr:hypothetical protein [Thermoplasmata archaeon]
MSIFDQANDYLLRGDFASALNKYNDAIRKFQETVNMHPGAVGFNGQEVFCTASISIELRSRCATSCGD